MEHIKNHINIESKKEYQGKNIKKLEKISMKEGYEHKLWGTFLQWKSRGHFVERGQKGVRLSLFTPSIVMDGKKEGVDGQCYHFTVFNLEQTTPERELEKLNKQRKKGKKGTS